VPDPVQRYVVVNRRLLAAYVAVAILVVAARLVWSLAILHRGWQLPLVGMLLLPLLRTDRASGFVAAGPTLIAPTSRELVVWSGLFVCWPAVMPVGGRYTPVTAVGGALVLAILARPLYWAATGRSGIALTHEGLGVAGLFGDRFIPWTALDQGCTQVDGSVRVTVARPQLVARRGLVPAGNVVLLGQAGTRREVLADAINQAVVDAERARIGSGP
jgi:hypothetical protein